MNIGNRFNSKYVAFVTYEYYSSEILGVTKFNAFVWTKYPCTTHRGMLEVQELLLSDVGEGKSLSILFIKELDNTDQSIELKLDLD